MQVYLLSKFYNKINQFDYVNFELFSTLARNLKNFGQYIWFSSLFSFQTKSQQREIFSKTVFMKK